MSAKNVDKHNRFRSITVGFRVSPEEQEELNRAVAEAVAKTATETMPADSRVELEKTQIFNWERSTRPAHRLDAPHPKISPLLQVMS